MALRTNSKKAKENIKNYIIESFHDSAFEYWHDVNVNDYGQICSIILSTFYIEKVQFDKQYQAHRISLQDLFFDWCQGLPSILNTCYYYNVNARDLLGSFLDETAAEKAKYTEEQAETCITLLLWRELNANGAILPKVKKADVEKMDADYKCKNKNGVLQGFFSGLIGETPSTTLLTEDVHFIVVRG